MLVLAKSFLVGLKPTASNGLGYYFELSVRSNFLLWCP